MSARLVSVLALLAAMPARADLGIGLEASIGGQRLGIARAPATGTTLQPMGDLGATLLVHGGPFTAGGSLEGNLGALRRYDASVLAGLSLDPIPFLRLDLLGEYGHASLASGAGVADGGETSGRFYGLRPGVSVKLPLFPLRIGAWGLARWNMPGTTGGPAYGMLGRIGIDF